MCVCVCVCVCVYVCVCVCVCLYMHACVYNLIITYKNSKHAYIPGGPHAFRKIHHRILLNLAGIFYYSMTVMCLCNTQM